MRILFLIRSLERGGAERQLVELVKHLDRTVFEVAVVTFYGYGRLARDLEGLPHVRVINLEKRGRWDTLRFGRRLLATIRAYKPDVIHGYMPGANELAAVIGRTIGCRVVWGVRASNVDLAYYDWTAPALFRAGAWLSRAADLIIVNSHAGRRHHVAHGYADAQVIVIPNGIDVERFHRDEVAGAAMRRAWAVSPDVPVIGIVGRFDPMKDHATFLGAAQRVAAVRPDARFAVVGHGSPARTAALQRMARERGVFDRVVWVEETDEVAAVYNALDIVTSSSAFGEGFSNTIGEGMACERVPVATDVGDAARIIGDTGMVVPPRDEIGLSTAWAHLLAEPGAQRREAGQRARARIVSEFSVATLARRTEAALSTLLPVLSPATVS